MPQVEIEIQLNGRSVHVPGNATVERLLEEIGATGPGLAVAVNDEVVQRSRHAGFTLQPGDRVEVIQAVGGG